MSVAPVDVDGGDRTWTYSCPLNKIGRPLKEGQEPCGFESLGHATKASATRRGSEHHAEHETGQPMREIGEFVLEVPFEKSKDEE